MPENDLYFQATDESLTITLVLDGAMNYPLAHNGISPLRELQIANDCDRPMTGMN